jgi:hypothetical protein
MFAGHAVAAGRDRRQRCQGPRGTCQLWVDPQPTIEPFFPKDHDKGRVFEIYRDSQINFYYRWFQMGHVMDFCLRQASR